jgi:hypothetical protein
MKNNYKYSFSFLFILNLLEVSVPENAEPIINLLFGIFFASLLIIFNIINAFVSLFSLYILNKYNVDENLKNSPILKKIIKYYENTSLGFIFFEIGMSLILSFMIFLSSIFFLGINIYK